MHTVALADEQLLRDALELAEGVDVAVISREPLGEGAVAGFQVRDGDVELAYFVDTSRRPVERETGLVAGDPAAPDARVWLHPADPHLPALAPVAFAGAAESLLARLGLTVQGAPETIAYRAGRRAVLRVAVEGGTAWVKVVPPARVQRIVDAHAALAAAGVPVPAVRGWSEQGLLVLDAAVGTPVQDAEWRPDDLLDEVDRLREAISEVALGVDARTDLPRRLDWYVRRFQAEHPDRAARAESLRDRLTPSWGSAPARPIHGDLHFGQLFIDDRGRLTGIIDVDTAGAGAPGDDTGAFLSHAIASAVLTPAPRDERVWQLARSAIRRWDGDPVAGDGLRARAVTHLLGHALGALQRGEDARGDVLLDAADDVAAGRAEGLRAPKSGLTSSFEGA